MGAKNAVLGPVKMVCSYDAYDHGYIAPLFRFVEFDGNGLSDAKAIARARKLVRPHALAALWICGGRELYRDDGRPLS